MPVPSASGLYQWRFARGRRWRVMDLLIVPPADGDIGHALCRCFPLNDVPRAAAHRLCGVNDAYQVGGEWGPRIEEPD